MGTGLVLRETGEPDARASSLPAAAVIAEAARSHRLVVVGEIHRWSAEHRLLRRLLRDVAVGAQIDDVVVEFGNSRHQDLVDAYVAGAAIPASRVARAWLETTQGSVWASSDYANFFAAVRAHNDRSRAEHRLRVLLGDPPIDVRRSRSPAEHDFWILQRDIHFAHVIQKEVIAKGRRALVVAGVGHVLRLPDGAPTLTNLLEATAECATDPRSIRAGIDWCDDLRRNRPVADVYVIVPAAAAAVAELELDDGVLPAGDVVDLSDHALGAVELGRLLPDGTPDEKPRLLRESADALLLVGS